VKPEARARQKIDQLLAAAGWNVQHFEELNLSAALGVAVREFPLKSGFADYLLFIDRKAVGVIEAKPEGTILRVRGVAEQSEKYLIGLPDTLRCYQKPLPFGYESTGTETFFRDLRDPDYRSRRVFAFHQPQTLREWIEEPDTLRARLRQLPPLNTEGLRDCPIDAIANLERSFAQAKSRALIQMATGSGKTYTAVSFIYRLIKFAGAKRVLFLVDRSNLGKQTLREFQQYVTPDDGRKFTELYNVQRLTSNTLDRVSKVYMTTIQRLYSMLKGEAEFEEETEEESLFDSEVEAEAPKEVNYNSRFPLEDFDFIITDECHRSIYNVWRQVLEYYDAFLIGLTATPSLQTFGFFNQNLVMEYNHDRAVADGVNVGYEVYRIRTRITEQGSTVEAGHYIDRRSRLTRAVRWQQLDENLEYSARQLDRDIVSESQIRTIIRTFKNKLSTEIFPGREEVPKTLIFAKDDTHAEDIVEIVRQEFGKGNQFCKKITYRTTGEGVCESDKSDSRPLERKRSVPFDKLLQSVALDNRDEDTLTSLAGRLARLDRKLSDNDRTEIQSTAGREFKQIINGLLGAVDPDQQIERAKVQFQTETPTQQQVQQAAVQLADDACTPFDNPQLRKLLDDLKTQREQIIDTVSQDQVLSAGFDTSAREKAQTLVESFQQFIEQNKDAIAALQIIYNQPYGQRQVTYEQIRQLASAIARPPHNLTTERLWQAYEQLETSKVRGAGPQQLLTNVISLVRFAIGETDVLEPFPEMVNRRFQQWLEEQQQAEREFTPEQREWLVMIKDHIATSLSIEVDDFEYTPFDGKGGQLKAVQLFGRELNSILIELNAVLAA
jgi:type I site-specific restriction endonuclease